MFVFSGFIYNRYIAPLNSFDGEWGIMGKDSEGINKTKGEIVLLPNFRTDNSDSGSNEHQLHTVRCVLSCTAHNFANSQIKNLLGRVCFPAIMLKPNWWLSMIIFMPSFKIQIQRIYTSLWMRMEERSCHGFKWEYH